MISHALLKTIRIIGIVLIILIAGCCEYGRFQAMKKYFPAISYSDYLFTESKIRITNDNN